MLQEGPVGKRATTIVLAGILAASLTGCTFNAVQATQKAYDPSDGFGTTIGNLEVRNAMLFTEDGEVANLAVALVNSGQQNLQVQVSWETEAGRQSRNVYIPAGAVRSLGADNNQFLLQGIDAPAGSLFPVYFQYDTEPGEELPVPVLAGELTEYEDLVPETGE